MDQQLSLFNLLPVTKEDYRVVMKQLLNSCEDCRLGLILHPNNRGFLYRGSLEARIAVVGEAPGDTETEQGRPLVGASGKLFEKWAHFLGLDTKTDVFISNVVQCFPGDTQIEAIGIRQGFRRLYSGPAIRIRTPHNVLTGTPNHPVLTNRGWVPLGELHQGDYLIRCNIRREESSVSPDIHYCPARFDEVFNALEEEWVSGRIVGTSNDFHGDGSDSEINVVRPSLALGRNREPAVFQQPAELNLVLANDSLGTGTSSSTSNSSLHQSSSEFRLTTGGAVCTFRDGLAVPTSRPDISSTVSLEDISNRNASLQKAVTDGLISDTSFFLQALHAYTGEITFSQVVEINVVELSEHVYNLETWSHTYLAQGFVVSNCQPDKELNDEGKMAQRPPSKDEIGACFGPRVLRALRSMPNLEVIWTLGWVAAETILGPNPDGTPPKSKTHENTWFTTSLLPGVVVYCMVHPAFILRDPSPEKDAKVFEGLARFRREYLDSKKVLQVVKQMESHAEGYLL